MRFVCDVWLVTCSALYRLAAEKNIKAHLFIYHVTTTNTVVPVWQPEQRVAAAAEKV